MKSNQFFSYQHRVQFYETDTMGVVHHSNYLRFCEEARVAWAHSAGLIDYQKPESASHFAVLETRVRHLRPAFFGDSLVVFLQVKLEGIRIFFQYKIQNKDDVLVLAETTHVPLDKNLKPMRLTKEFRKIMETQVWKEIWL
ncbi:MAG: acyl-CoA thioesterase [Bdellovibrionaceae bacterium]|nr:acyl-CoA thioesterase [Pseudobdellovibrionaceae bacterium]